MRWTDPTGRLYLSATAGSAAARGVPASTTTSRVCCLFTLLLLPSALFFSCARCGGCAFAANPLRSFPASNLNTRLVIGHRDRGRISKGGELCFENISVLGLGFQRDEGCLGCVLSRLHLLLAVVLPPVTLGAGDFGLGAQALGVVSGAGGIGIHLTVRLDESVHRAQAR